MDKPFYKIGTCCSEREAAVVNGLVSSAVDNLTAARDEALATASECGSDVQHARAMVSVLADLMRHGWSFRIEGLDLFVSDPGGALVDSGRERVRRIQLGQRELQLNKQAVREFVRSMERKRLGPNGWTSIFSVMRDGDELACSLRRHGTTAGLVPAVIDPYIQVIENAEQQRCSCTGLRLMDIWRYFRYTWAMPYNSVPGRSMLVLIRDAAVENHPVIGIAALGSAIVQLSERDAWIGWNATDFVRIAQDLPIAPLAHWVNQQLDGLIHDIYTADLCKAGTISRRELTKPSDETVVRLRLEAQRSWNLHRKFPRQKDHKAREYNESHWKRQTVLPLFKAKRCETLARLLQAKKAMIDCDFTPTSSGLRRLTSTASGRRAMEIVVRACKAQHVGIDMLDITICGAVPPYNPILGGKLIALLLCSPEIQRAYARRYKRSPSIIASSMAGHTVCRPPRLVLLGTTSLYGERLNQYHRVQLPAGIAGARDAIRYTFLGESVGFGSSHLCCDTVQELELLLAQSSRGRRVNSIFGEGVSPRLRKIRDGLDVLGLPPDLVLNHGHQRLVYAVPLASNFREVLLGLETVPRYILPQRRPIEATNCIAKYWGSRWLATRIANHPEVLDAVALNDLRIPDRHSAKVQLPNLISETLPLFA